LRPFISRVNAIRREYASLQTNHGLQFHLVDNDQIICYSKPPIIVLVNLDPRWTHAGFVELPLAELGIDPRKPYVVHDLLTNSRYTWQGPINYVELRSDMPAHILIKE
jgi:starch synthase (maltosyl-transferring)